MSDQTFTGSVIALNNYVLSVKVMHIADDEEEVLAAFRLLPSHDSSRFLEYLFNFCRSEHKNAASFSIYAGKVHVDHYLHVTLLEFRLGVGRCARDTSPMSERPGAHRLETRQRRRGDQERN